MKKKIEISMKELFIVIGRRWLVILVAAVIVSGAYTFAMQRHWKSRQEKERIGYETALAAFEKKKPELEKLYAKKAEIVQYLSESPIMTADLSNKKTMTITLKIISENSNITELRRVIDYYIAILKGPIFNEKMKVFYPEVVNKGRLGEVISYSRGTDDLLSINIIDFPDVDINKVAQSVLDYMYSERTDIITSSKVNFEIEELVRGEEVTADQTNYNIRRQREADLTATEKKIDTIEADKPKSVMDSKFFYLKEAIIGALIGIVLSVFLSVVYYMKKLTIQYPEQLQDVLDLQYLGYLNATNDVELKAQTHLIYANILAGLGEPSNPTILLAGYPEKIEKMQLISELSKESIERSMAFYMGDYLETDADSILLLLDSDSVIFVGRINETSVRSIYVQQQRVQNMGKQALGYILL